MPSTGVHIGLGEVGEAGLGEHAGVGAQHVDAAEPLGRRLCRPLAVRGTGHIRHHGRDLTATEARQLRGSLAEGLRVAAGDGDVGAGPQEDPRDAPADALAAAGDQHRQTRDGSEHDVSCQPNELRYRSASSQLPAV
jgi:cytosine/adenosine deaminase-related metal-dependent hydrolase